MSRVTPAEYADKMARRLAGATQDITRGIERVTENPAQAAIAQKQLLIDRFMESINNGKWEEALGQVTLQEWKTAAREKGVPRIASGINAAKPKLTRFAQKLLPAVDAASATVKAMPKATLEDRINRATTYMREMANFRK